MICMWLVSDKDGAMADYIEREYDVDAIPDVYCNTPDIDLDCEKLNGEKLEVENLKLYADDVTTRGTVGWKLKLV